MNWHRSAEAAGYPALLIVAIVCLGLVVASVALLALTRSSWVLALALLSVPLALALLAAEIRAAFGDADRSVAGPQERSAQATARRDRPAPLPQREHEARQDARRRVAAQPRGGLSQACDPGVVSNGPVVIEVDGTARSIDALSLASLLGPALGWNLLIAYVHRQREAAEPALGRRIRDGGPALLRVVSVHERKLPASLAVGAPPPTDRRLRGRRARDGSRSGSARRDCAYPASQARWPGGGRRSSC